MRAVHHEPKAVALIMPAIYAFREHPEIKFRLLKGSIFIKIGRQSYTIHRDKKTKDVWLYRRADPKKRPVTTPFNLRKVYEKFMVSQDPDEYEQYIYRVVRKRISQLLDDAAEVAAAA